MRSTSSITAFLACLAATGCVKAVPPDMHPAEIVQVPTDDGWTLDLRHYPGEGPPVMLVHGMGANHYNWDYAEEISLADDLAKAGWDVWVPELRGDPGSVAPSKKQGRNFTFDDHAIYDLPAHTDAVLGATGEDELYWVGHSMGGILLYTAARDYPDKVAAGVAICSPVTMAHPNGLHKLARGFGWAVSGKGMIRQKGLVRFFGGGRAVPIWGVLANRDNIDWPLGKGLAKNALVDLPRPMAKQAVGWMRHREIHTVDGEPWMPTHSDIPLLAFGGAVDRVVPADNVEPVCDVFEDCTYHRLGTESGFAADYGHIDPVMTPQGAEEVFPMVLDWLEERREAAADAE